MTVKELLQSQIANAGYQLQKVSEGLTPEQAELKPHAGMMSFREQLSHLSEAYVATSKELRGEKHDWGTYHVEGGWDAVLADFQQTRATAAADVLSADDATAAKIGSDFMVGHDYYHVGQLASVRLAIDPSWNSYSIYR